jgi:hypothetical protein
MIRRLTAGAVSLVALFLSLPETGDAQSMCQRAEPQCVDHLYGEHRPSGPRTPHPVLEKVACEPFPDIHLPTPVSNPPGAGDGTFRAGFAKLDLEVPDGYGLAGYGTEGRIGRRRDTRPLRVRALVVEGAHGEIVAFALADLLTVSAILHREAAAIVHERTAGAIGADRLFAAATHTHSAPGHYFSNWPINLVGSQLAGFSPELTEYLAQRIAAAVIDAYQNRQPARAAWEVARVWGYTRNRAVPAARLNASLPALSVKDPSVALDEAHTLVNPRWAMLRVDTRDPNTGRWVPAGALSIFAIHGTGIPSGSEYYDADIPGAVAERVEREYGDDFVYLFANGTEGDVSPGWPPNARCPLPRHGPTPRPAGPRTPPPRVDFTELDAAQLTSCLQEAEKFVYDVGQVLADTALAIFERLGEGDRLKESLEVRRAFNTLDLGTQATQLGLCERPMVGTATAAGGADGLTRHNRWRLFGLFSLGIEAGGSAIDSGNVGCHRPKRVMAPIFQSRLAGPHQYPSFVQLAAQLRYGLATCW